MSYKNEKHVCDICGESAKAYPEDQFYISIDNMAIEMDVCGIECLEKHIAI